MIVTLLRKPLEGTVAENTLKHGCGGINIDATRISTSDNLNGGAYSENPTERHDGKENWRFERGSAGDYEQPSGRWPANFILTHRENCELKGTKKIKEGLNNSDKGGTEREVGLYKDGLKKRAKDHHQGQETIADWACVEGCPVQELDRQSGNIKSGSRPAKDYADSDSGRLVYGRHSGVSKELKGSSGGASRFFKQFKKDNEK
jgi:hypothetical protein